MHKPVAWSYQKGGAHVSHQTCICCMQHCHCIAIASHHITHCIALHCILYLTLLYVVSHYIHHVTSRDILLHHIRSSVTEHAMPLWFMVCGWKHEVHRLTYCCDVTACNVMLKTMANRLYTAHHACAGRANAEHDGRYEGEVQSSGSHVGSA